MHLAILHQAWIFGGAERTTRNLLSHLDRSAIHRLTLMAPEPLRAFMPDCYDDFVDTSGFIRHGWFGTRDNLRNDLSGTAALLAQVKPDLALGMMHYSAALLALARREDTPRLKRIGSFRGPIYEYIRRYESGWRRRLFLHTAIGMTARKADRIIVPSQGTARDTRRRFLGPARRIEVIPNGIDANEVRDLAEAPIAMAVTLPAHLPKLCVAARLWEEKEIHLVIDAISLLRYRQPCALMIVGEGAELPKLQDRARDLGLEDRVVFLGYQVNVFPYMRQADLYVHTCQFEGFGYSMLEAMACGTPVVATDCPHGPREVLSKGRDGVLVKPGDAVALAEGIERVLADSRLQEQLRRNGLRRAEELSLKKMASRYLGVFQSVLVG